MLHNGQSIARSRATIPPTESEDDNLGGERSAEEWRTAFGEDFRRGSKDRKLDRNQLGGSFNQNRKREKNDGRFGAQQSVRITGHKTLVVV